MRLNVFLLLAGAALPIYALAAESDAVTIPSPAQASSVLPTSPASPPAPAEPAAPPQPVMAELNDGSKIEMDADASVWVLGDGGAKTPAPDGTLTLKDGTPFIVKDGKRIDE